MINSTYAIAVAVVCRSAESILIVEDREDVAELAKIILQSLVIAVGGFGPLSLLCGLAPNFETLVLFRVMQGLLGGP